MLQVVGLGPGGTEIAGGAWILLTGARGIATRVLAIGDVAGAIAWFIAVGLYLTLAAPKSLDMMRIGIGTLP